MLSRPIIEPMFKGNADLLRFPSGPWMARHFHAPQALENGALHESRLGKRELIQCQDGIESASPKHAGSNIARSMRTAAPVVIACALWAACLSCACAQEADSALPGWLVTSQALESKIAEAQAATDRTEEAKTQLIELYRQALSNLQTARAGTFHPAAAHRVAGGETRPGNGQRRLDRRAHAGTR
jgi:hypothetical protein